MRCEAVGVSLQSRVDIAVKSQAQRQKDYRQRMKREHGDAYMKRDRERKARQRRLQKEKDLAQLYRGCPDSGLG